MQTRALWGSWVMIGADNRQPRFSIHLPPIPAPAVWLQQVLVWAWEWPREMFTPMQQQAPVQQQPVQTVPSGRFQQRGAAGNTPQAAQSAEDPAEALKKLKAMLDAGLIPQEVYSSKTYVIVGVTIKKSKILGGLIHLIVLALFHALYFGIGGVEHPAFAWISYGFIHFSNRALKDRHSSFLLNMLNFV